MLFVCIISLAVIKGLERFPGISPLVYEVYIVSSITLTVVLAALSEPWYTAHVLGLEPSQVFEDRREFSDSWLLLSLDLSLTVTHLALPIRWHILWPFELIMFICYAIMGFVLGNPQPGQVPYNTLTLGVLTWATAVGKRTFEFHERHQHLQLLRERSLRCESEFKLSQIKCNTSSNPSRHDDARSSNTSSSHRSEHASSKAFPVSDPGLLHHIEKIGHAEEWIIPAAEMKLAQSEVCGRGGFGTVLTGSFNGKRVAIKFPNFRKVNEARDLADMANEIRTLRKLRHPNIVLFYGLFKCSFPRYQLGLGIPGRCDLISLRAWRGG